MITVIESRCPQNHPCPCVRICPVKAITQDGYGAPKVNMSICVECGKCIRSCPYGVFTNK